MDFFLLEFRMPQNGNKKNNSFHPEFPHQKPPKCAPSNTQTPMSPAARVVPWLQKSYWPWFRFAQKFHGKLWMQSARVAVFGCLEQKSLVNLKMISFDQAFFRPPDVFFPNSQKTLHELFGGGIFSRVKLGQLQLYFTQGNPWSITSDWIVRERYSDRELHLESRKLKVYIDFSILQNTSAIS